MKTSLLRATVLAALLVSSASASFAGPGLQYWNARRDAQRATKPAVTAPADEKCERMLVKQGKRTSSVACTPESVACKAHCAN